MKPKSHIIVKVLTYGLGALSVAAGIPKLLQMPQELTFLSNIGFDGIAVAILGVVQLLGGTLLFAGKTRLIGIGFASLAFVISSIAIFVGGDVAFGLVSLLPVLALLVVAYFNSREQRDGA